MLFRRLRGLLVAAAGGAFVGGTCGALFGLMILVAPGPKTISISPEFPGAIILVPALWGAVIGAMSGGTFGLLLMLTERGHGVTELRAYRTALWAAVAAAAALRFGGGSWTLVGLGSALGAGIGAGATVLARRGADRRAVAEDSISIT
jgi:hypothetical protein